MYFNRRTRIESFIYRRFYYNNLCALGTGLCQGLVALSLVVAERGTSRAKRGVGLLGPPVRRACAGGPRPGRTRGEIWREHYVDIDVVTNTLERPNNYSMSGTNAYIYTGG